MAATPPVEAKRTAFQSRGRRGKRDANEEIDGRGNTDESNGKSKDDFGSSNDPEDEPRGDVYESPDERHRGDGRAKSKDDAESGDDESNDGGDSGDGDRGGNTVFSVVYQGCFQDGEVFKNLRKGTRVFHEVREAGTADDQSPQISDKYQSTVAQCFFSAAHPLSVTLAGRFQPVRGRCRLSGKHHV